MEPHADITASRRTWVVILTGIASMMAALDTVVVATALSTVRVDLHASVAQLEWTVNAYNLSFAVLLMPAAALGDRFGRRRMFAVGLAVFSLASAACALSPDAGFLIAARAVQGAGAAFILPLALAILTAAFPAEKRGTAIGLFSAVTGIAVALGPIVGGAIVRGIDWSWIFWVNVPIGLIAIPFVLRRLDESFGKRVALDFPGVALITAAAFGVVWGLVRGNSSGWGSAEVVGSLVAGAVFAFAFVRWELRTPEPMLPMSFFRSRTFSAGNAAIFFVLGSLFADVFFFPQLLQTSLGYDPLQAGLRLMVWTATFILVAPGVGALVDRIGERPLMVAGLLIQAGGTAWIASIARPNLPFSHLIVPLVVAGRRDLDGDPVGPELRRRVGDARDRGQARRDQQHDARARRRVRDRGRGGRVRRLRRLQLTDRVHRRVRPGDLGLLRPGGDGRRLRPGAAEPPPPRGDRGGTGSGIGRAVTGAR